MMFIWEILLDMNLQPRGSLGSILIVEDDGAVRAYLGEILSGYNLFVTATGEEAVLFAGRKRKLDLVICDFNLPGWNGVETLQRIRPLLANTKFILMSGIHPDELEELARHIQADAWFAKPIDGDALLRRIESLLKSGHGLREWSSPYTAHQRFSPDLRREALPVGDSALAGRA